jgi:hypothetical protein
VAGRMDERDEDLARSGAGDPHVIVHHRVAAGVAMFDPQPFENTVAPCGSGSGTESQVSGKSAQFEERSRFIFSFKSIEFINRDSYPPWRSPIHAPF